MSEIVSYGCLRWGGEHREFIIMDEGDGCWGETHRLVAMAIWCLCSGIRNETGACRKIGMPQELRQQCSAWESVK